MDSVHYNRIKAMNPTKTYRHDLDLLKGLAIIAVVLYHAGWCKSGYLGVDVFLVLSGYFTVPRVLELISEGRFRYWAFLEQRLFRLLPLVLLVTALSLLIGYWGMLPGDYRYLSEEAVATSVFSENFLQAITTQNYWAAIYHKVLMHTWYLGVLFQFYVAFPLLMVLLKRRMRTALVALTALSLLLYLLPIDTIGNKYYLLPYRFFEIAIGGLLAMMPRRGSSALSTLSLCFLVLMTFFGAFTIGERAMPYNLVGGVNTIRESFLPREVLLLLTVLFTSLFVRFNSSESSLAAFARSSRIVAPFGRMSLSLFLWHQPLFVFYRYFYADELSLQALLAIVCLIVLLSLVTYHLVEQRLRITKTSRLCLLLAFLAVNAFALHVYWQGGAVRDVPELDIRKGMADADSFERYTDRIYQYDHDFPAESDGRMKVLVVGNSFARDFANILLESPDSTSILLSYHYSFEDCPLTRVRNSDRIYFFGWKHQVPDRVWKSLKHNAEVWGIGTKNHGRSNGIFYKKRHRSDYFRQRTTIRQDYHTVNRLLREEWQNRYVDLLSLTLQADSTVPVFTPDHHFITYDGLHLTPAGTQYYSKLLKALSTSPPL